MGRWGCEGTAVMLKKQLTKLRSFWKWMIQGQNLCAPRVPWLECWILLPFLTYWGLSTSLYPRCLLLIASAWSTAGGCRSLGDEKEDPFVFSSSGLDQGLARAATRWLSVWWTASESHWTLCSQVFKSPQRLWLTWHQDLLCFPVVPRGLPKPSP